MAERWMLKLPCKDVEKDGDVQKVPVWDSSKSFLDSCGAEGLTELYMTDWDLTIMTRKTGPHPRTGESVSIRTNSEMRDSQLVFAEGRIDSIDPLQEQPDDPDVTKIVGYDVIISGISRINNPRPFQGKGGQYRIFEHIRM